MRKNSSDLKVTIAAVAAGLVVGGGAYLYHEHGVESLLNTDSSCGKLAPPELLGDVPAASPSLLLSNAEKAKNTGECAQLIDTTGFTMRQLGSLGAGQEFTIECYERSDISSWRVRLPNGQEGDVLLSGEIGQHLADDPSNYPVNHFPRCPITKDF